MMTAIKCKYCNHKIGYTDAIDMAYRYLFVHLIVEHWEQLPEPLLKSFKDDVEEIEL